MVMEKEKKNVASAYLSICIPTWNRATFLQDNVSQLLREIEKCPHHQIEVVISDNASTDETSVYCESLIQQYPFIFYKRNSENMGPNANFQQVIENANGTYIWLLGDDDKIVENCLEKIIADCEKFNKADILVGGSINDETKCRLYPPFINKHLLSDKEIVKQYDVIRLAGKISVLIFKRQPLLPVLKKSKSVIRSLKTPWPHLIWVVLLLNQNRKILFLPYATNYFIEKNRCNLLFDGISNINILVREYAAFIYHLNNLRLLTPDFFQILNHSITRHRQMVFFKAIGYATYLNGYFSTLSNGFKNLCGLHDFYNRSNFFIFYIMPIILPAYLRKGILKFISIIFPNWSEYKRYLYHLKTAKKLFTENNKRNIFAKKDL